MFRVRSEFQRAASLGPCASSFPVSFLPPTVLPHPTASLPCAPWGSPRAAAPRADSVWSSESLPPGWLSRLAPPARSPHSLSGHRGTPRTAHNVTWGPVTAPRRVVIRPVEIKPRTESGRPSSPSGPGNWLWFQTRRVRKACLAYQTLKSCLST